MFLKEFSYVSDRLDVIAEDFGRALEIKNYEVKVIQKRS